MITFQESQNLEERKLNQNKKKGLMKALKMSVVHVSIFVLSWTPYSVMATWLVFSVQHVQGKCLYNKMYWLFYNCNNKKLFTFIRTVCTDVER